MKFGEEKLGMRMVRELDPVLGLEGLTGNKLEIVGPILDGFLKEIGSLMSAKLSRSKMTGLMIPVVLFLIFMPFPIFKHVTSWVLAQG